MGVICRRGFVLMTVMRGFGVGGSVIGRGVIRIIVKAVSLTLLGVVEAALHSVDFEDGEAELIVSVALPRLVRWVGLRWR